MKSPEDTAPYLVCTNSNTGRLEFLKEEKDGEHVVASMPGDSTDNEVLMMCERLRREAVKWHP